MIKKLKCNEGKVFQNVNISNGLFFFERCSTRVIQFVCTHRCSYKTTSFEKEQSIV